jgi:SRSO17 transposase
VWTSEDAAVAAAYRVDAQRWSELFETLMDTIEERFARPEPRRRVREFVAGLLAPLPVKNCWTIAEYAGNDGPGGMQDLIGRPGWDDAVVRADVRDFVAARLGHPDGILVLPKSWSEDPARCAEAGVPDTIAFATKPQPVRRLIETAVAGGLPCRWVAGDEAYGGDPQLAAALRGHRLGYVLAVACSHRAPTGLGVQRADHIAAGLPKRAWQRLSAGEGAKGFRCWKPQLVALHHLVAVAGRRWSIEESFQATKTGLGLDQHQHRRWRAWHRWTTLVIAAHAFLAAATTASTTSPDGLITITVNELRRLFDALVIDPVRRIADVIAWSIYRRRHQDQAKTSHYARQALSKPSKISRWSTRGGLLVAS